MKKLLLVIFILISSIIGQTDNIGSEAFNETADRLFHAGNEKDFSDGTYLFKSSTDRSTVDTSGMFITDTTVGAAVNSRLLQGGQIITSTAADINLLSTLASDGYSVVIDSSGWMVGAPRTIYGWSNGLTFSATDHNTIAWTSGYLIFANLDSFAISAGNTGDITAATWVYLDPNVSTTVLQTTTSAGLSVGLGRVIVCVCEDVDSPKKAVFQVMGGEGGGLLIVADNIAANAITANELAANSVTTSEIVFGNMGDSLFWSINSDATGLYINADKLIIGAGTTFNAGYDISDNKMVIYAVPPPATRPSGDALQTGDQWIADSTGGNIPKIWTGSAWETAFTYINGGYIETGTVDADRIDVSGLITAGSLIVSADNISDLTNDSNYKTVFTSEPTAPYYVGDLWTDGSDLYYCDTEQLTGAYDSNDWSLATNYDPDTNTGALVVRSDSRPDSTNYSPGDVWIDTNDGDKPYTLKDDTPDTWIKSYTIIDGGDITTGTVDADYLDVTGIFAENIEITGSIYTDQKTSFDDVSDGFWLGMDGATAKFGIGSGTNHLEWDGNNIEILGNVTLGTTNFINSAGKTSITDTDAGFFLGYDGAYKFGVGDYPNDYMNWDGTNIVTSSTGGNNNWKVTNGSPVFTMTGETKGEGIYLKTSFGSIATQGRLTVDYDDGFIIEGTNRSPSVGEADIKLNPLGTYDKVSILGNLDVTIDLTVTDNVDIDGFLQVDEYIAIEEGAAPAHASGVGKLWAINSTSAPLRYTTDDDQDLYVVAAIERTSLPGTTWPGRIVVDTDDNIAYIYADGGWRIIASGW